MLRIFDTYIAEAGDFVPFSEFQSFWNAGEKISHKMKGAEKMKTIYLELWEDTEYERDDGFMPNLDVTLLKTGNYEYDPSIPRPARPMVLICPGGAYAYTSGREDEPVATQFLARGYHTAVLHYSVGNSKFPKQLYDIAKAMLLIRQHAQEWEVNPDQIVVCGFSAGGHEAGMLATMWHEPFLAEHFEVESEIFRPNLAVLGYPVITSGLYTHGGSFERLAGEDQKLREYLSLEKRVTDKTPPTFLWHTATDTAVPVMNSILFAEALAEHGVNFELHIYPRGAHGLSIATREVDNNGMIGYNDPYIAGWINECLHFIDYHFQLR